jgi:hypothetical protein
MLARQAQNTIYRLIREKLYKLPPIRLPCSTVLAKERMKERCEVVSLRILQEGTRLRYSFNDRGELVACLKRFQSGLWCLV